MIYCARYIYKHPQPSESLEKAPLAWLKFRVLKFLKQKKMYNINIIKIMVITCCDHLYAKQNITLYFEQTSNKK